MFANSNTDVASFHRLIVDVKNFAQGVCISKRKTYAKEVFCYAKKVMMMMIIIKWSPISLSIIATEKKPVISEVL